jgi:hypothetical protein
MLRGTNVKVPREESDLKPTVLFDQIVRRKPAKGQCGLLAAEYEKMNL